MSSVTSSPIIVENYILIRRINEQNNIFVMLGSEQPETFSYKPIYLYREATKKKQGQLQFKTALHCFIMAIREQRNTLVMQYHVIQSSMFLTGRYFTLGLRQVTENKTHHIIKYGNIPIQLFVCREDSKSKFLDYVNKDLAIVDRNEIDLHFRPEKIESERVLPSGTIYFFYTISHCLFTLKEGDEQLSLPAATTSSTDVASASSPVNPPIPFPILESILKNMTDSVRAQKSMSFIGHVELKSKKQDTDIHALTMEYSGDDTVDGSGGADNSGDNLDDNAADDTGILNEQLERSWDENNALKNALAERDEKIAELEAELITLRGQQTKESPSSTDGISSSQCDEYVSTGKRKRLCSSEDSEFRETIKCLEDEQKSFMKQLEETNVRLRDNYERQIAELKKQCAHANAMMQAAIVESEVAKQKYLKVKEKKEFVVTYLQKD